MIYDENSFITYNQIYDLSNQIRLNIDNRNLILLICSNCIDVFKNKILDLLLEEYGIRRAGMEAY